MSVINSSVTGSGWPQGSSNRIARSLHLIKSRLESAGIPFALCSTSGDKVQVGSGPPEFIVTISDPEGLKALETLDELRIAEAYMTSKLDLEGDVLRLMDLRDSLKQTHTSRNIARLSLPWLLGQIKTNKKAIRHHYDLPSEFYLAYMDDQVPCYTQGVFASDDDTLASATLRKFDFCVDSCGLKAGSEVLEVGPGWGAFLSHACERGIRVTGITISEESKRYLDDLKTKKGYDCEVSIEDLLTAEFDRRFDAVILMGIMEHLPDYRRVVRQFSKLVKPGGAVYIDASACRRKYSLSSFTSKYIYPGNHTFLCLHDFLAAVADSSFSLGGVWDDQHSYFLTFRQWALNFERNRKAIIDQFGEQNYRRFRLYLWGAARSFLKDDLQCYRIILRLRANDSKKLKAGIASPPGTNDVI